MGPELAVLVYKYYYGGGGGFSSFLRLINVNASFDFWMGGEHVQTTLPLLPLLLMLLVVLLCHYYFVFATAQNTILLVL